MGEECPVRNGKCLVIAPVSPSVLTMRARCLSLDLEHNGPGYEWLDAGTQELQKIKTEAQENNMK